jgi:hypothetical protein
VTATVPAGTYYVRVLALNPSGASPPSAELVVTTGPNICDIPTVPTGLSAIAGEGAFGCDPSGFGSQLPGLWVDDKGCRSTRTFGGIDGLPFVSIEELPCNDGDFTMRITSRTATVVEGRCNSGPNCSFRMTRQ